MRAYPSVVTFLVCSLLLSMVPYAVTPASCSFDLSSVAYYDAVKNAFGLTPQQEEMLQKNGFIIANIPNGTSGLYPESRFEDFYYEKVYGNDLPVFVTTDSILHLFHVIFDCSLRTLEKQVFYSMILDLTQYAYNKSLSDYNLIAHDGSAEYWAVRNSTVYFAVATSLISEENATVPAELGDDLCFFLNNIYAESREFVSAANWHFSEPPYDVEVKYDFTQFTVRGHYLGEPILERYFRTLMWYGFNPIFIPRIDETYTWFVSHFDPAAFVYMRDILIPSQEHFDEWSTLYNVTSAFVGESDSINPLNLETALHKVFGGDAVSYLPLASTPNGSTLLNEELSQPEYAQKILSQALIAQMNAPLPRYPLVFQLMGQRYVPDSFMFQMLCWDKTGYNSENERRVMPKGIDVFSVLGSERADQLLIPDNGFENFSSNLALLKDNFRNLTEEEWTQNSYTTWIYSLQSLVNVAYDSSYPEFMRTLAWQDEKLNTALGSWAQLRHDTLLYAKQAYFPGWLCSYPEAFAEPNPIFYSRMQDLTERTIRAVNILQEASIDPVILSSLETVMYATTQLETISTKELNQQPLSSAETQFLKTIAYGCGSGGYIGWYLSTIHQIAEEANYTSIIDAPVIADVATFPPGDIQYPPQILHVGVGMVKALIVLYPEANGTLVAAVGPVYSYYEFPLIGTKRLNDDEWKNMLEWENITDYLPTWLTDVYGYSDPYPAPEYPQTTLLIIAFGAITVGVVAYTKITKSKARYSSFVTKDTRKQSRTQ